MFTSYLSRVATGFALLLCLQPLLAEPLQIMTSTRPVHSLVSQLTQGVSEPALLLDGPQSPHHFQLRPSQKRKLNQANLFIYSSDQVESFARRLAQQDRELELYQLAQIEGIQRLPMRGFHQHHHDHHNDHDGETYDGHIWLSVHNAQRMANALASHFIQKDPANAHHYTHNLQSLLARLDQLKQHNRALLEPVSHQPFLVYHDAFQYFEVENQLSHASFITTSSEHSPGIRRIQQIRQQINDEQIVCVFYEPPEIPPLLRSLQEDTGIQLVPLDPLGTQIRSGSQHYFDLMSQTAQTIVNCLKQDESNHAKTRTTHKH